MTPTNTEALAALSYAEAAKLLANELDYKYQRGIDPHDGEWREAVTLLHRLSAVEADYARLMEKHNNLHANAARDRAERDALRADAERYRWLREHGFAFADVSLGTDYEGKDYVTYRVGFHLPEPAHNRYEDDEWSAEDIDAAIDAARAAMKGTQ